MTLYRKLMRADAGNVTIQLNHLLKITAYDSLYPKNQEGQRDMLLKFGDLITPYIVCIVNGCNNIRDLFMKARKKCQRLILYKVDKFFVIGRHIINFTRIEGEIRRRRTFEYVD
jgi:hypothetical protein